MRKGEEIAWVMLLDRLPLNVARLVLPFQQYFESGKRTKEKRMKLYALVYIDSTFATGANEQQVAELLGPYANSVIRKALMKMQSLLEYGQKRSLEEETIKP